MIILTVGIPGSGKSTWAKEYIKDRPETIRVCRDELRLMLGGKAMLDNKGERLVTKLVEHAIANKGNKNIIVDQTNCNLKYLKQLVNFASSFDIVYFEVFNVSTEEAIKRDSNRENPVGEEIINRMYKGFLEVYEEYTLFDPPQIMKKGYSPPALISNIQNDRPKAVIFDIDGTLAHSNGKRGFFEWNKVGLDDVDHKVRNALLNYQQCNYKIIIMSGRDGICREETEGWLRENYITYDGLFMRQVNDMRKDSIIKEELYRQHVEPFYNVEAVFDDRNQVVNKWREMGLKCFQVAEGDF